MAADPRNGLSAPLLPDTGRSGNGGSCPSSGQAGREPQRSTAPKAQHPASLGDNVRDRYLHHLGQYRLASAGYVPNLEPILRWDERVPETPFEVQRARQAARAVRRPSEKQQPEASPQSATLPEKASRRCFRWLLAVTRPGSVRSSVINTTAAALGAGALALPRAIYYSGIVYGPLLMVALAVLSVISIKVIVQLVEVSHKDSYEEIAKFAFGPWFALVIELNIILFCFGTAVAYMSTVGEISHQVLATILGPQTVGWQSWLLDKDAVLMVVTACVLLPLSLLDSINDLRFASLFGVGCIVYLILVVVYVFATSSVSPTLSSSSDGFDGWKPKGGFTGCFKMLSLAIFAFCCQPNVPAIYTSLERRSFSRMERVTVSAMVLCFVVYMLVGIAGFLAFGEETAGNVLQNLQPLLCKGDRVVVSGFLCMAAAVTMAFPLNIFPIRFAVETVLFYHKPWLNTKPVRYSIAFVAVALSLVVAVALPEINLIFELIGATTGSFVCFIGPGVLFCRLAPGSLTSSLKRGALWLVAIGVIFLLVGTYSSVLDVMEQLAQLKPASGHPCAAHGVN